MFADAMADDDGAIDAAGKIFFFRLRLVLLTFDDLCFRLRFLLYICKKLKFFKIFFSVDLFSNSQKLS